MHPDFDDHSMLQGFADMNEESGFDLYARNETIDDDEDNDNDDEEGGIGGEG